MFLSLLGFCLIYFCYSKQTHKYKTAKTKPKPKQTNNQNDLRLHKERVSLVSMRLGNHICGGSGLCHNMVVGFNHGRNARNHKGMRK